MSVKEQMLVEEKQKLSTLNGRLLTLKQPKGRPSTNKHLVLSFLSDFSLFPNYADLTKETLDIFDTQ